MMCGSVNCAAVCVSRRNCSPIPGLGGQLRRQHLDHHILAQLGVMGFEHPSHAALADQLDQPIAPEVDLIHRAMLS